jgi:hypothetical protein
VTALSIMWQRCRSCDSTVDHVTALSIMWQRCRSCDSAVDHVTTLSMRCNSAVNAMRQCCRSSDSTVMRCDSAVDHVTALLIMWQHCQWLNNVEFKKKENWPKCEISNAWAWCDSTVDATRQHCRPCDSAILRVITQLRSCQKITSVQMSQKSNA